MEYAQIRINIGKLRFMSDLPVDLREKLAHILVLSSVLQSIPAGTDFIREDDDIDDKGYILLEGTIFVRKFGQLTVHCDPPQLMGEMQQFNPARTRTATLTTSTQCAVLCFEWDEFWNAAKDELTEPEIETVRQTLKAHAWEHFLR